MALSEGRGVLRRTVSNISNISGYSMCQVCFEPFQQNTCVPKLLPCGHSFCQDCVTALRLSSIYICKCPTCRHAFPLRYDTHFPTNYSLLDLLAQLEPSLMAKKTDGVAPQNEVPVGCMPRLKGNKSKSSKIPQSTSRMSQLFSKISGRHKKASSNRYYMSAKAPFTSTPDMSAEEDGPFGVEVAYVETESEDNNESEPTIPAAEVAVHEDTPATVRYVNATIILDDTAPDQSSSSSSGNNTCCGEEAVKEDSSQLPTGRQGMQPMVTPDDPDPNVVRNTDSRCRNILKKIRHVAFVMAEVMITIFAVFWSVVIAKVLYADFHRRKSEPSALCSGVQTLDSWLPLGLAKAISCDNSSDNLLGRLYHEAQFVITFLATQLSFTSIYYDWLITTANEFYEESVLDAWENVKEIVEDYGEIVRTCFCDFRAKCFCLFTQVYLVSKDFASGLYEGVIRSLGFRVSDDEW